MEIITRHEPKPKVQGDTTTRCRLIQHGADPQFTRHDEVEVDYAAVLRGRAITCGERSPHLVVTFEQ